MALVRSEYEDEQLRMLAEHALAADPLVPVGRLAVASERGVVVLAGTVTSEREQTQAVDTVRQAFEVARVPYDRVMDELVVSPQP
ncbi:MAG: BON domain-containing protein [Ardenticatenaceae bacterium]|nr:BON domain-containing protein [Ardenticatenaceae bacterium]